MLQNANWREPQGTVLELGGGGCEVSEGLAFAEGLEEPDDIVFDLWQGHFGRLIFDVVDVPVIDTPGPLGKRFEHHGQVFGFFHGDGHGSVREIVIGERGWFGAGAMKGDVSFEEGVACLGGEVGVDDVDAKSAGRGEPIEPQGKSMEVKQGFGEAAAVDIARADEDNSLFIEHGNRSLEKAGSTTQET
jgi:hypothetical protein